MLKQRKGRGGEEKDKTRQDKIDGAGERRERGKHTVKSNWKAAGMKYDVLVEPHVAMMGSWRLLHWWKEMAVRIT